MVVTRMIYEEEVRRIKGTRRSRRRSIGRKEAGVGRAVGEGLAVTWLIQEGEVRRIRRTNEERQKEQKH